MTNDKQRERLVELLQGAYDKYINLLEFEKHIIANHLIENGVIVTPCKVGDTAYFLIEDKVAGEKYITPEPIVDVCTKGFYTSGHADSDENGNLWLWSDVGEIVFFDKDKAEEALKGGVENG